MRTIILIGCSKTKKPYKPDPRRGGRVTPAEFYDSQLFRARVDYAESRGEPWAVLSAGFGVWFPNVEYNPCRAADGSLTPYDYTLADLSPADRAVWHAQVAYKLVHELWEPDEGSRAISPLKPSQLTVELHAGKTYTQPLAEILQALGINAMLPVAGLSIGQQLQWYSQKRENTLATA